MHPKSHSGFGFMSKHASACYPSPVQQRVMLYNASYSPGDAKPPPSLLWHMPRCPPSLEVVGTAGSAGSCLQLAQVLLCSQRKRSWRLPAWPGGHCWCWWHSP
ncbi:hypothetical protein JD844_033949 [Phrynosoma platyrhinos]|uniref:Uncharacterized protein n=1 Tax=Phrynosoma platyrhinos TaxID=52577 RepID=A0ABQ7T802_PHRPL|nr:hypothetical protein JD844_033949 [Phrynosoma platyrhinos]